MYVDMRLYLFNFFRSDLPSVPGQRSDHLGLLVVHQWPVYLPGGGEGGVRTGHWSAVRDLLRLQPFHDLRGFSSHSGRPTGEA